MGLGSAAAWPMAARAQQPAMPVIGYLGAQSADVDYDNTVPFLQGLKDAGYVEGQNVAVEYRYAENEYDRLPAIAADLVRRRVAVILAKTTYPPQPMVRRCGVYLQSPIQIRSATGQHRRHGGVSGGGKGRGQGL